MRGIDISNWQSGLKPSSKDIDFCICKATEGINFVDATCRGFIQDCQKNNIVWGFYHFARENKPEDEAEFFYKKCSGYFGKGIPVLDYETSNYDNVKWCERFIKKVHDLSGVWCMIYISASRCGEFENSWIPEKCALWVAGYPYEYTKWINGTQVIKNNAPDEPKLPYNIYPFKKAAIWQFTSSLQLGAWKLDGNIAYINKKEWVQLCKRNNVKEFSKSIDDYVLEVLLGEYGDNEYRKRVLGDKYNEVQERINELYKVANEVTEGKWGNGWNRQKALEGAGYPYKAVQLIVNKLMA